MSDSVDRPLEVGSTTRCASDETERETSTPGSAMPLALVYSLRHGSVRGGISWPPGHLWARRPLGGRDEMQPAGCARLLTSMREASACVPHTISAVTLLNAPGPWWPSPPCWSAPCSPGWCGGSGRGRSGS